ncbi:MAG: hypothetical protein AAFY72_08530, partial [Cyanobacteria bacterium J06649_4]
MRSNEYSSVRSLLTLLGVSLLSLGAVLSPAQAQSLQMQSLYEESLSSGPFPTEPALSTSEKAVEPLFIELDSAALPAVDSLFIEPSSPALHSVDFTADVQDKASLETEGFLLS